MRSATVFLFSMIFIASNNIAYAQKSKKENIKEEQESDRPPRDSVSGKFKYQEIVQLDSLTQDEIFNRAKSFLVKKYISTSDILQLADFENGEIIAKVTDMYGAIGGFNDNEVTYTIKIEVKKGRYRYAFENFSHSCYMSNSQTGTRYVDDPLETTWWGVKKRIWKLTHEMMIKNIAELKQAIEGKSKPDDNW